MTANGYKPSALRPIPEEELRELIKAAARRDGWRPRKVSTAPVKMFTPEGWGGQIPLHYIDAAGNKWRRCAKCVNRRSEGPKQQYCWMCANGVCSVCSIQNGRNRNKVIPGHSMCGSCNASFDVSNAK